MRTGAVNRNAAAAARRTKGCSSTKPPIRHGSRRVHLAVAAGATTMATMQRRQPDPFAVQSMRKQPTVDQHRRHSRGERHPAPQRQCAARIRLHHQSALTGQLVWPSGIPDSRIAGQGSPGGDTAALEDITPQRHDRPAAETEGSPGHGAVAGRPAPMEAVALSGCGRLLGRAFDHDAAGQPAGPGHRRLQRRPHPVRIVRYLPHRAEAVLCARSMLPCQARPRRSPDQCGGRCVHGAILLT